VTAVVQVRFFAHYRDRAGMRDCEIEVDDGSTVADLVLRLRADPRLDWLPPDPLIAVNRDYADYGRYLASGDEVAFIPPVSGG
jgi:molybdopterin converting factor subunit 1